MAVELLPFGNKLDMPQFTIVCELTISQNFDFQDLDSVLTLVQLADLHQATKLYQLCSYLILNEYGIKIAKRSESYSFLSEDLKNKLEIANLS